MLRTDLNSVFSKCFLKTKIKIQLSNQTLFGLHLVSADQDTNWEPTYPQTTDPQQNSQSFNSYPKNPLGYLRFPLISSL